MLGNDPFYHQLTRKAVVLFGRLFDDIFVVRTNDQTGEETGRFRVPIIYSQKEKMVTRLFSDPDLLKQIQVQLDRKSTRLNSSHSQQSRMPSSA